MWTEVLVAALWWTMQRQMHLKQPHLQGDVLGYTLEGRLPMLYRWLAEHWEWERDCFCGEAAWDCATQPAWILLCDASEECSALLSHAFTIKTPAALRSPRVMGRQEGRWQGQQVKQGRSHPFVPTTLCKRKIVPGSFSLKTQGRLLKLEHARQARYCIL